MVKLKKLLFASAAFLASGSMALAQNAANTGPYLPPPPTGAIQSNDSFQDVVNSYPQAQSFYVTASQLGAYSQTLAGGNADNAIVGGDFNQNTWARGTTSATINTTAAYGPSDFFLWSGTSTNLVATQQTGAADILPASGILASARVTRSSTGVVQSCIAQEVESSVATRLAGTTAEFSFYALAGSGFSAASSNLAVYIVTGTSTDEGSSKMAYGINALGGGGSAWAGSAVLGGTSGYLIPITTVMTRYGVAAPIPATAKEVGVAICWTPVGTSPSNDYVDLANIQLVANPALTGIAGTAGVALNANDVRLKSFVRRQTQAEIAVQQRYVYAVSEPATAVGVGFSGNAVTTTTCNTSLAFPVIQRAAPTFTAFGTALSASTWKINYAATSTTLATTFYVTTTGNTPSAAFGTWTTSAANLVAGGSCFPVGQNGGSVLVFSSEL